MTDKTRMTVQTEDPEPYLCGNERAPHTRLMEYDGSLATVLTWRPIGSVEADSLGWRFIATEGRTVAVRPVQLPSNARPFCVPQKIESALRAVRPLISLAHGRVSVNGVGPDAPDQAERLKEIALYEINAFIGHTTGKKPVPVREPRKGGGYTAGKRAAIVKKLTDPKDKGAAILEEIRSFILHELFKDANAEIMEALNTQPTPAEPKTCPPARGLIRDSDLRRLVRFMGDQIGRKDMALSVLRAYNSAMPEMFKGWVAETVKTRKMKPADAERFLAERVTFIAECEGRRFRHCYPIEDMTADADIADREDQAPYQVPVRDEGRSTRPPTGHATYEVPDSLPARRPGRPKATKGEREHDARIHGAWKASGERTVSDFALKHDLNPNDVRRAINTDAHRQLRKVVVKSR